MRARMRRRIPKPAAVLENLDDHPASRAWLRLCPGSAIPCRIDEFSRPSKEKKKRKSSVFRLHGVGSDGGTIIAKRGRPGSVARELLIYEHFLSRLPISSLRVLGSLTEFDDDMAWLFVKDGGDCSFSRNKPRHRSSAARWLAGLHTGAEALLEDAQLPLRGPDFYHGFLSETLAVARETRAHPALTHACHATLDEMNRVTEVVERRWSELNLFCGRMPMTLVHGDFIDKNVKVGVDDGGVLPLFVFDWEQAGIGCPAIDLATSNWGAHDDGIREYLRGAREHWRGLTEKDVRRMLRVGQIFRCVASIRWACGSLRFGDLERRLERMSYYLVDLDAIASQPI
jgi:phosphotransferase family enzyme